MINIQLLKIIITNNKVAEHDILICNNINNNKKKAIQTTH